MVGIRRQSPMEILEELNGNAPWGINGKQELDLEHLIIPDAHIALE